MAKKRAHITDEQARDVFGTALDRLVGGNDTLVAPLREAPRPREEMIKLSVFLTQQEDAYLENLASTAKFSGGKKLSKTKLIQAMVRAFRDSELDGRGVRTEEELLRRVNEQMQK